MNRKIEVGCMAVSAGTVNHSENRYKTVRVLYDATDQHDSPPDKVWCVEGAVYSDHFGVGKADFLDRHLIIIDDYDSSQDVVEEVIEDEA